MRSIRLFLPTFETVASGRGEKASPLQPTCLVWTLKIKEIVKVKK
jgi:hypothetical protein